MITSLRGDNMKSDRLEASVRLKTVFATAALVVVAGCASSPPELDPQVRVRATSALAMVNFVDARPEGINKLRTKLESGEHAVWLGDDSFSPVLSELFSGLLAEHFRDVKVSAVKLIRADVGVTKGDGSARYNTSYYRGTPYIPPGTHPGAAALGILLGEGIVFLAANAKTLSSPAEAPTDFWTAYVTVEIDGGVFYGGYRAPRLKSDDPSQSLLKAVEAAAGDIASQHRVRTPELYVK